MTAEMWRPIPGFDGYEASAEGQIKSYKRGAARLLRGCLDKDGYRTVCLTRSDGRPVVRPVHQFVVLAFHGPRPDGMEEIRHLDGDRLNNAASNLRYGTRSENRRDSVRHGTCRNALLTECPEGHPYDAINTYRTPDGRRECRICRRARNARWQARRNGLAA